MNRESIITAATDGNLITVQKLFPQANETEKSSALEWSAFKGHHKVVKYLLTQGVNPVIQRLDEKSQPLNWASGQGHWEVVKEILKYPQVDPSIYNNYCLLKACKSQQTEIVKILLTHLSVIQKLELKVFQQYIDLELIKGLQQYWVEEAFTQAAQHWLPQYPILCKNFIGFVDPEILKPYNHLLGEFDMF